MRHSSHLILLKIAQMDDKFPFYADENSDPSLSTKPAMAVKFLMGPLNQTNNLNQTNTPKSKNCSIKDLVILSYEKALELIIVTGSSS